MASVKYRSHAWKNLRYVLTWVLFAQFTAAIPQGQGTVSGVLTSPTCNDAAGYTFNNGTIFTSGGRRFQILCGIDLIQDELQAYVTPYLSICVNACVGNPFCLASTYDSTTQLCSLKGTNGVAAVINGLVSAALGTFVKQNTIGVKPLDPELPTSTSSSQPPPTPDITGSPAAVDNLFWLLHQYGVDVTVPASVITPVETETPTGKLILPGQPGYKPPDYSYDINALLDYLCDDIGVCLPPSWLQMLGFGVASSSTSQSSISSTVLSTSQDLSNPLLPPLLGASSATGLLPIPIPSDFGLPIPSLPPLTDLSDLTNLLPPLGPSSQSGSTQLSGASSPTAVPPIPPLTAILPPLPQLTDLFPHPGESPSAGIPLISQLSDLINLFPQPSESPSAGIPLIPQLTDLFPRPGESPSAGIPPIPQLTDLFPHPGESPSAGIPLIPQLSDLINLFPQPSASSTPSILPFPPFTGFPEWSDLFPQPTASPAIPPILPLTDIFPPIPGLTNLFPQPSASSQSSGILAINASSQSGSALSSGASSPAGIPPFPPLPPFTGFPGWSDLFPQPSASSLAGIPPFPPFTGFPGWSDLFPQPTASPAIPPILPLTDIFPPIPGLTNLFPQPSAPSQSSGILAINASSQSGSTLSSGASSPAGIPPFPPLPPFTGFPGWSDLFPQPSASSPAGIPPFPPFTGFPEWSDLFPQPTASPAIPPILPLTDIFPPIPGLTNLFPQPSAPSQSSGILAINASSQSGSTLSSGASSPAGIPPFPPLPPFTGFPGWSDLFPQPSASSPPGIPPFPPLPPFTGLPGWSNLFPQPSASSQSSGILAINASSQSGNTLSSGTSSPAGIPPFPPLPPFTGFPGWSDLFPQPTASPAIPPIPPLSLLTNLFPQPGASSATGLPIPFPPIPAFTGGLPEFTNLFPPPGSSLQTGVPSLSNVLSSLGIPPLTGITALPTGLFPSIPSIPNPLTNNPFINLLPGSATATSGSAVAVSSASPEYLRDCCVVGHGGTYDSIIMHNNTIFAVVCDISFATGNVQDPAPIASSTTFTQCMDLCAGIDRCVSVAWEPDTGDCTLTKSRQGKCVAVRVGPLDQIPKIGVSPVLVASTFRS